MRLPEEISAPKLRVPGDEVLEALRRMNVGDGIGDRPRPTPRQTFVELLRNAVVVTPLPGSVDETLLGLQPTMPPVENPGDANVVDVADP